MTATISKPHRFSSPAGSGKLGRYFENVDKPFTFTQIETQKTVVITAVNRWQKQGKTQS